MVQAGANSVDASEKNTSYVRQDSGYHPGQNKDYFDADPHAHGGLMVLRHSPHVQAPFTVLEEKDK